MVGEPAQGLLGVYVVLTDEGQEGVRPCVRGRQGGRVGEDQRTSGR